MKKCNSWPINEMTRFSTALLLALTPASTSAVRDGGQCCNAKAPCGSASSTCVDPTSWCGKAEANCVGKCGKKWCPDAPPAPTSIAVNSSSTHSVSEAFISFTLDASKLHITASTGHTNEWTKQAGNFSDPAFVNAARLFAPAHFRFGGTSADAMTYDMSSSSARGARSNSDSSLGDIPTATLTAVLWDELNAFAAAANWSVIFGVNALVGLGDDGTGAWDGTNARTLFEYTKAQGHNVVGWELGNEPDLKNKNLDPAPMDATLLAADFSTFSALLRDVFGATGGGTSASPWAIGPDCTKSGVAYASTVIEAIKADDVDVIGWHHYYVAGSGSDVPATDFALPSFLNEFTTVAAEYVALYDAFDARRTHKGTAQIWLTETGGAGGSTDAAEDVTGTFYGALWYADKLGVAASNAHSVVLRQEWVEIVHSMEGGGIEVVPGFWLALMWRRLMGQEVLGVPRDAQAGSLRVYAHRSSSDASAICAVVINLDDSGEEVAVPLLFDGINATTLASEVYTLTAWPLHAGNSATDAALNGVELALDAAGNAPAMFPKQRASGPITVPSSSVTFMVFTP